MVLICQSLCLVQHLMTVNLFSSFTTATALEPLIFVRVSENVRHCGLAPIHLYTHDFP